MYIASFIMFCIQFSAGCNSNTKQKSVNHSTNLITVMTIHVINLENETCAYISEDAGADIHRNKCFHMIAFHAAHIIHSGSSLCVNVITYCLAKYLQIPYNTRCCKRFKLIGYMFLACMYATTQNKHCDY